jgi:hypothetical protein
MTASLVATSSAVAFFLGRGELAALSVTTESVDLTDSMDNATAASDLSDIADVLEPALEDFSCSVVSGSLEGLASSSAGAVVVDTRVLEVSGVTVLDDAGMGVVDVIVVVVVVVMVVVVVVVVMETVWSVGLLVDGALVVAGADAIVGFTWTHVSSSLWEPVELLEGSTSGLALFCDDSMSNFAEESVTNVFFSVTGFDSVLAVSELDGALALLLFAPGLELVPGLGLFFFTSAPVTLPLLAGGSGGFPADGFRLLFLRKTACCLLTAGDGPFF